MSLKLEPRINPFSCVINYTAWYIRHMHGYGPSQKNRFESIGNPFAVLSITICPVKLENCTTSVSIAPPSTEHTE